MHYHADKKVISCYIHKGNMLGTNFIVGFIISLTFMLFGEPASLQLVNHIYVYPVPLQAILTSVGFAFIKELFYNIRFNTYMTNFGNICLSFIGTMLGILFIASSVILAYYAKILLF